MTFFAINHYYELKIDVTRERQIEMSWRCPTIAGNAPHLLEKLKMCRQYLLFPSESHSWEENGRVHRGWSKSVRLVKEKGRKKNTTKMEAKPKEKGKRGVDFSG